MTLRQLTDDAWFVDLSADILDRQVTDCDTIPVCKVDDLEFDLTQDGQWQVVAILLGPGALGPRIGGWVGATMSGLHRRLRGMTDPSPPGIAWNLVRCVGSDVVLSVSSSELPPDLIPLEDWLREHVIARIPGSKHASK